MMPRSTLGRSCVVVLGGIVLLSLPPRAQEPPEIVVWKVGSPHTGETPRNIAVPAELQAAGARLGLNLRIQTFPAAGFASIFSAAVSRGTPPDLIALDNLGRM